MAERFSRDPELCIDAAARDEFESHLNNIYRKAITTPSTSNGMWFTRYKFFSYKEQPASDMKRIIAERVAKLFHDAGWFITHQEEIHFVSTDDGQVFYARPDQIPRHVTYFTTRVNSYIVEWGPEKIFRK